jgi:hypothetical protein
MDAPVALGDTPLTFARGLGSEFDFYGVQPAIALDDAIHLSPRDHQDRKGGKQVLQMLSGVAGEINHEF